MKIKTKFKHEILIKDVLVELVSYYHANINSTAHFCGHLVFN